jgi:hypothetical protein
LTIVILAVVQPEPLLYSSGNVTDEVIMEYIMIQDVTERAGDDDFTISP